MYLKSVTVKGFKSFAKKTELEFQPGISMIVGPNGSGKSNITDAIQWVLGEQSPNNLRGSSMQDVIFAGSLNHKPLGLAEVTLALDNTDKSVNLDFSEITVTRRISRSGENFYAINSTPCRLLDIFELLHDSRLGRQTHSIIGQGKLEEVISSKPEEKRTLLEEAAGVLKHKKRKERALRKLISTEDNLKRAKDILREINQQLKPLEHQVSKAKSFNQLTNRLKKLEIALIIKKISTLKNKADLIDKNEQSLQAELQSIFKKESRLGKQIAEEEKKYRKQADEIVYRQTLNERLTVVSAALKNFTALQKHKQLTSNKNIDEIKEQFSNIESQLNLKTAQIKNLKEQITKTEIEINRNLKSIALKRKESEHFSPDFNSVSGHLSDEQQKLSGIKEEIRIKENESLEKANSLYFCRKEENKQKQQLVKFKSEAKTLEKKINTLKNIKKEKESFLGTAGGELVKTTAEVTDLKTRLGQIELKKSNLGQTESQLKERLSFLLNLQSKLDVSDAKFLKIDKDRMKAVESYLNELATDKFKGADRLAIVREANKSISVVILLRLNKEIKEAGLSLKKVDRSIASMDNEIAGLLAEQANLEQEIEKTASNRDSCKAAIANIEGEINLNKELRNQKNKNIEETQTTIKTLQNTSEKLKEEKKKLNNELDSLTRSMLSIEKNIENLTEHRQKFLEQKQNSHLASTELNYQAKNLNHQLLALKNQLNDNLDEHEKLEKQRKTCLRKLKQADESLLLNSKLMPLIETLTSVSNNMRFELNGTRQSGTSFDLLKKLTEEEKQLNEQQKNMEIKKQQFITEKSNIKINLDNLVDVLAGEHGMAVESAIQKYSQVEANKNLISSVRQQLAEIGPVNAVAEEQFSDLDKRRSFLEKQIEDLLRSKSSINKIIRAIDNKIKESLLYAFQEISQNFKQLFCRLFPGGRAELVLTGDNIFESGLDVQAQPYGKNLKKLSLLSGGETALTALALLFAVYHTRPSPFYVLDEVEAALDDINLQRFIRLLKEMKNKTQFIVITHQRRTMEVADCLYGITMQADGVTKVVSQKMVSADKNIDNEVKKEISVS